MGTGRVIRSKSDHGPVPLIAGDRSRDSLEERSWTCPLDCVLLDDLLFSADWLLFSDDWLLFSDDCLLFSDDCLLFSDDCLLFSEGGLLFRILFLCD